MDRLIKSCIANILKPRWYTANNESVVSYYKDSMITIRNYQSVELLLSNKILSVGDECVVENRLGKVYRIFIDTIKAPERVVIEVAIQTQASEDNRICTVIECLMYDKKDFSALKRIKVRG